MNKNEIQNKVLTIIQPYVKNEDAFAKVTADTTMLGDLQINSARLVDIILGFEDAFDIEIEDEDADKVNSVGDAVNLLSEKLAA
ncbi:MAG: acyl carrier protein [Oceanococcus sp.]|nr:MAG: acyl carrier protein [Oceanococcus sp.]